MVLCLVRVTSGSKCDNDSGNLFNKPWDQLVEQAHHTQGTAHWDTVSNTAAQDNLILVSTRALEQKEDPYVT